jgi:hypothetical protein
MTSLEINPRVEGNGVSIGPPGTEIRPEDVGTPRLTPTEWARRRRVQKEFRGAEALRDRALGRLTRLRHEWHLIDAVSLGFGRPDAFVAIGPGGVFAVTVKSQGRARVRLSGSVIQIGGDRPNYIGEAQKFAKSINEALTKAAGTDVPVHPILALAGSGIITVYGQPRGCAVIQYRELDNLLSAAGHRISATTVEKLASIARHPASAGDLRSEALSASYRWNSVASSADKFGKRR